MGPHRLPQRLSRRHERWLYLLSALLLISGSGWLLGHYLLRSPGEFGELPHPSELWWLRLHGAAVIGFLVAFGALLPAHVIHGWRRRKNRSSGVFMLLVVGLLALSGYGLYYVSSDELRRWISVIHWSVGLVAAGGLVLHVVLGKRGAARQRAAEAMGAAGLRSGGHGLRAAP